MKTETTSHVSSRSLAPSKLPLCYAAWISSALLSFKPAPGGGAPPCIPHPSEAGAALTQGRAAFTHSTTFVLGALPQPLVGLLPPIARRQFHFADGEGKPWERREGVARGWSVGARRTPSPSRARVYCTGQTLPAATVELALGWKGQECQAGDRQHGKREAEQLARGGSGPQGTGKMASASGISLDTTTFEGQRHKGVPRGGLSQRLARVPSRKGCSADRKLKGSAVSGRRSQRVLKARLRSNVVG